MPLPVISQAEWIGILSEVLHVDIAPAVGADLDREQLDKAIENMDSRHIEVLRYRFGNGMSCKEVGTRIQRRTGGKSGQHTGPIPGSRAWVIVKEALKALRHPNRLRALRAAIGTIPTIL